MVRSVALLLTFVATTAIADEWLSGTWSRGERKLDRALQAARASGDGVSEARLLGRRAHFLIDRGRYHRFDADGGATAIAEAGAAAEAAGDPKARATALHAVARWHYWRKLDSGIGEWETVDAAITKALEIREQIGDKAGLAESWFYRGLVRQFQRQLPAAGEAFERSLAYAHDPLNQSFAHRHLGYILELSGDIAGARSHYAKSLELRRGIGAHVLVPFALNLLAEFELETTHDGDQAKSYLLDSVRVARCAGSWRALHAAEAALVKLDPERSHLHARRALEAAERYGDPLMIAQAKKALEGSVPR